MPTQFVTNIPLCRHGMRDDCPVEQCRFGRGDGPSLLYSSAPKVPALRPIRQRKRALWLSRINWACRTNGRAKRAMFSAKRPAPLTLITNCSTASLPSLPSSASVGTGQVDPLGGNGIAQAVNGLAIYQTWLESQVKAQLAKIQAMSSQFSMPIPHLDVNPFEFGSISTPVANNGPPTATMPVTTPPANRTSVSNEPMVPILPPAPRLPPAQPAPVFWKPQDTPPTIRTTATGPSVVGIPLQYFQPSLSQPPALVNAAEVVSRRPQVSSTAPKKGDMAYKTTPCRHFTLNNGWCPWGDECGFIHDPQLEWVPPSERTSGWSTPNSTNLIGSKSVLPDKTAAESLADLSRSASSNSAHCWGYIQGTCPYLDRCKYLHPQDYRNPVNIKYTPCLIWPRCGYPTVPCPLKHPQVDKLSLQPRTQRHSTPSSTTIVPQPAAAIVPRTETYSDIPQPPYSRPPSAMPVPQAFVIPHDEAYASAKWHHVPTAPSSEMFSPPPPRAAVRLRRASEDAQQDQGAMRGVHQGRVRRVSIAVHRLDTEFAGAAPKMQATKGVRGHARGKSLNL
ncbi:hypothetical protein F5148DRAFT_1228830 [Russula earlei]|uniref:Uncharacterized protein n=1 Tax=Russula earlei TaxID=71964 RepID=A0ACC0TZB7_9AGAM|nr:hypothetical protein F5148DRAFT_1228830 [Russula earlei]